MILRRILAAVALLCAFALPSYAQTGSAKTSTQLNSEINQLFPDQTSGQITPFNARQTFLDMVASGLGGIALSGDVTGSGFSPITTTLGPTVTGVATFTMKQTFSGGITGLPSPVSGSDAANKTYVDSVASGITVLAPSALATTTVLPNTPTYSNGALGVGATLTAGTNSTLTVDGTVAVLNAVVLVKNQASAFQNGIYTVTTAGSGSAAWVLTRATYFDQAAEMKSGSYTLITSGTVNANSAFTLQTAVTTVGTDPLNFLLFSQGSPGVASGGAVIATRAAAAALNLSNFTTITTQGYANPGDGGGATFIKFSTGGFKDSTILTGTISNAGASCTNGIYNGLPLTGGSGVSALVNVTVSGNIVSAVTSYTPNGNGYIVGDVLGIPSSIGCSGATWTVASVLTATGSFTDNVGTKFQIVTDAGNFPNVRQFGAKINWINSTGDAGANDDSAAFKSGLAFAYYGIFSIANGGTSGGTLQMPSGTALVCSTLTIPVGVDLNGAGPFASVIKQCDSSTSAAVNLGDPNSGISCFGPRLSNIEIFMGSGTPASGIAAIFTNCAQQQIAVDNVTIYARSYECMRAVTGFGGAASLTINGLFCTVSSTSVDGIGIHLGYGAAVTTLTNTIVESGSNFTGFGINIPATAGGVFNINGFHCEQVSTCINWAPTAASVVGDIQHATGGASAGCAVIILRQSTAVANQLRMGSITPNGCTTTYNNGGGAPTTGNVISNTNI